MTENTLNKEFLVALENCRSFKRPLTPDQVDQLYKALDLADMIIHPKAKPPAKANGQSRRKVFRSQNCQKNARVIEEK